MYSIYLHIISYFVQFIRNHYSSISFHAAILLVLYMFLFSLCRRLFRVFDFCVTTVDAVYAMAHALHKIIKEQCEDGEFSKCDVLQSATMGPDLLRAIREISFIGMQGTQVRIVQRSKYIYIASETNDLIISTIFPFSFLFIFHFYPMILIS